MSLEDLAIYLALGAIGIGFLYKVYLKLKPTVEDALEDGKITVEELLDIADDVVDVYEMGKALLDDLPSEKELLKLKKDELKDLAQKHGLKSTGTKADIVKRLLSLI